MYSHLLEFRSLTFLAETTRGCRPQVHRLTHSHLTVCWQNLQNSTRPDAKKSFKNCSALCFGVCNEFLLNFWGGRFNLLDLFGRGVRGSRKVMYEWSIQQQIPFFLANAANPSEISRSRKSYTFLDLDCFFMFQCLIVIALGFCILKYFYDCGLVCSL